MVAFRTYDFRWVREYNQQWEQQTELDPDCQVAYTAILLHYDLDVSLLMRYLGNNFTGAHRNWDATIKRLRECDIPETMIQKYRRVAQVGCPAHFVTETSRENALLYTYACATALQSPGSCPRS